MTSSLPHCLAVCTRLLQWMPGLIWHRMLTEREALFGVISQIECKWFKLQFVLEGWLVPRQQHKWVSAEKRTWSCNERKGRRRNMPQHPGPYTETEIKSFKRSSFWNFQAYSNKIYMLKIDCHCWLMLHFQQVYLAIIRCCLIVVVTISR